MKLQYASDLHLEFPENEKYLLRHPIIPGGDILILAGDIVPFSKMDEHSGFFDFVSDNFPVTYWLPGNHEYYHSDIGKIDNHMDEKIRENVILVNNTTVRVENINLIFSTLWTKIGFTNRSEVQMRLSDFHVIRNMGKLLTIQGYDLLHEQCLSFVKEELKISGRRKIVITHHVPTFLNYPEEYKGDPLNEAFGVELSDLIRETGPDFWIFGHHHSNKHDFRLGETFLVSNQLGYVIYHEQAGFERMKVIEL